MRVAVVTGPGESLTASTLAAKLAADGSPPVLVLRSRGSGRRRLRTALGSVAILRALRTATRGEGGADAASTEGRHAFAEYARRHGLERIERPLAEICRDLGVPLRPFVRLNAPETVAAVAAQDVDLLLNCVPTIYREMLSAPRVGSLNAHMGPLPEVRGMNALEWSLLLGHPPRVTVHFMAPGIDTGGVLLSAPLPVEGATSIGQARGRLGPVQVDLFCRAVRGIADGSLRAEPQRADAGRQYFVMHERLRRIAERRLRGLVAGPPGVG